MYNEWSAELNRAGTSTRAAEVTDILNELDELETKVEDQISINFSQLSFEAPDPADD